MEELHFRQDLTRGGIHMHHTHLVSEEVTAGYKLGAYKKQQDSYLLSYLASPKLTTLSFVVCLLLGLFCFCFCLKVISPRLAL